MKKMNLRPIHRKLLGKILLNQPFHCLQDIFKSRYKFTTLEDKRIVALVREGYLTLKSTTLEGMWGIELTEEGRKAARLS